MNEKNGIREAKPKQSWRQGESAPELPVGRAYAVEALAVGKVLIILLSCNVCALRQSNNNTNNSNDNKIVAFWNEIDIKTYIYFVLMLRNNNVLILR